jgi:beta-glucanase (GH16 family)
VNGSDYYTYNNLRTGKNQWPFDQPQYLLLNVAVGGVLGGTVADSHLPATMEVEWVRVYKQN